MVVADGPKIFHVYAFGEGYLCFCLKVFVDLISFTFYMKHAWKKCYNNFFGHISQAPILFKWYQKTSGYGTDFI